MYKRTLLILAGILLVCGAITWHIAKRDRQSLEALPAPVVAPTVYYSAELDKTVDIRFLEKAAVLNGVGYGWTELVMVEGETPTKYMSKEENLALVLEGEDLTLYRGRKIIFSGTVLTDIAEVPVADPATIETASSSTSTPETPSIATSSDEDLEI